MLRVRDILKTVLPGGVLLRTATSFGLALMLVLMTLKSGTATGHAAQRSLTFEDRVAAQRAIELVYWRYRIWPADNPQPKPAFDEVLPDAALRVKVAEYLRESRVLEANWQRPITAVQLQTELDRMASQTQRPEVLRELWAALGNDPVVVAECLARPVLAERLLRELENTKGGGGWKEETTAEPLPLSSVLVSSADWWSYRLPEIVQAECASSDVWTAITTGGPPGATDAGDEQTAVWTPKHGSQPTPEPAPLARSRHTAVWTGSEMIVWGGQLIGGTSNGQPTNTGGRYNPATVSWTATATTGPSLRSQHTAVWTGSEMIVWGGYDGNAVMFNTGGRYNPATDSWINTTTSGVPSERASHTAVWTGSEMIIWCGASTVGTTNTGGRYNPSTDSWISTSTNGAPIGRASFTAVWTGSEMIVWGGFFAAALNTGGRYNPSTDSWTATTTNSAPIGRSLHTAVWTGSEMIVWGGLSANGFTNTGGRYNPSTDSWINTNTIGAPDSRVYHTAVWTGTETIVWGGFSAINTGGRYNPSTDSWIAITTNGAPSGRELHTAVWTGSEMIVWGGAADRSGGRFSLTPLLRISPTAQSFTGAGASGTVIVTAQGGCTWTATSNTTFITITSGSTGAGDGTVSFSVNANPTTSERSGKITVTGQTLNIVQAGAQPNPFPTIADLSPPSAVSGGGNLTVTVNGSNFVPGSVVRWNGSDRVTTFVSGTQVTAQLLASDLMNPGIGSATVFNPLPGGGTSNTLTFPILSNVTSVSAASYVAPVAAESIVAGFGVGLASTTQLAQSVLLPTTLAGVFLKIRDSGGMERDAPLFFVSPAQINFLIPTGTATGMATTRVFRGDSLVGSGTLQIATVAPGLFTANSDGQGVPASYTIRVKPNGQQIAEDAYLFNQQVGRFVPREIDLTIAGDRVFLILFGTGIRFFSSINNVVVRFGNQDQQVDAALPQGRFVGLDQVNVEMLRSKIPPGPVSATLRVDGIGANSVDLLVK